MSISQATQNLVRHLASRPGHDEVKADFRQLLIEEFGVGLHALDFERRVPEVHGRLDALIGRTVFEAKSDLDREWPDIERRMPDYLADRQREEGEPFVGIGSDGQKWAVFELAAEGKLEVVKRTLLDPERPEVFLAWLDGAVALKSSLPPDPLTIRVELGEDSVAYRRVNAQLRLLWEKLKADPVIGLKRQLWADLLKLVYGREIESDRLWFQHTFLVVVAKCIAVAVMRLVEDDPKRLLSGDAFTAAGINGAVESDFFDWVVGDPEGEALIRRIMNHVRRFRLAEVETDVLKTLYESLIDRQERHGLGEYYTPDWLAAKMVRRAVDRPLEQRVLDPGCGSGTFLFHAIRSFLREAEEAAMPRERRAAEACAHIAGMDIHPVTVIIGRVTYLLALSPALTYRAGLLSIPVYLGDAMQLSISEFMAGKELTIRVPPPPAGDNDSSREQLSFPETFCRDPALFDKAIEQMRTGSLNGLTRAQIEAALTRVTEQHYRDDTTAEQKLAIEDLGKTYLTFDRLRRDKRDTIWAYVARNLSRPLAYSASGGWANVVIGNPPWLAFRHMSADLQKRFRKLADDERVYVGGRFATQNDLSALFSVRVAHLYLRSGGRLALIFPMAALTRGQFEKLRTGSFQSAKVAWDEAWTMDDSVQPLFPVPSCAVFGRKQAASRALPATVRAYSGDLPFRDAPEAVADTKLRVIEGALAPSAGKDDGGSKYRTTFRNGATLFPRVFVFVERKSMGLLGTDPAAPAVVSRRTSQEKKPWKSAPTIEGRVEAEFLRPILLGESILPYRVFRPFEGIVPITASGLVLDAEAAANRGYGGLHDWMRKAESVWDSNKHSDMTLVQRFDYFGLLSAQFLLAPLRVVYTKAGTLPVACILRKADFVIENLCYWAALDSDDEARYLAAILNSETARARAAQYQARGQWGARHFDKVMFNLPIPRFDPADSLHVALADAATEAERLAAAIELKEGVRFQQARRVVRGVLTETGLSKRIDALVARLLDAG
jgi:hypothetical protein